MESSKIENQIMDSAFNLFFEKGSRLADKEELLKINNIKAETFDKHFKSIEELYFDALYKKVFELLNSANTMPFPHNNKEISLNSLLEIFFINTAFIELNLLKKLQFEKKSSKEKILSFMNLDHQILESLCDIFSAHVPFDKNKIKKKIVQTKYLINGFWVTSRMPEALIEKADEDYIKKQYVDFETDVRCLIYKIWESE